MAFGRSPQPVDVFIVDADASQRRALAGMIAERSLGRFQAHACASELEALSARSGDNRAIGNRNAALPGKIVVGLLVPAVHVTGAETINRPRGGRSGIADLEAK